MRDGSGSTRSSPRVWLLEITRQVPGTTRQVPGTTRQVPGTTRQVPGTTRQVPGTTRQVPGTTRQVPGTTRQGREAGKSRGESRRKADRFQLRPTGGGKGIRTPDLQLAKLPLYQLSY